MAAVRPASMTASRTPLPGWSNLCDLSSRPGGMCLSRETWSWCSYSRSCVGRSSSVRYRPATNRVPVIATGAGGCGHRPGGDPPVQPDRPGLPGPSVGGRAVPICLLDPDHEELVAATATTRPTKLGPAVRPLVYPQAGRLLAYHSWRGDPDRPRGVSAPPWTGVGRGRSV